VGNNTDQAFAENDRILIRAYITNIGTMGSGRTCTLTFNGADASTGDSFFNIAETVSFKSEAGGVRPFRRFGGVPGSKIHMPGEARGWHRSGLIWTRQEPCYGIN
jgi:hypothetical protein